MTHAARDPFNVTQALAVAPGKSGTLYSLPALGRALGVDLSRLPVSIRIVLESVLRNCDGNKVTEAHVRQLAGWKPNAQRSEEIPFVIDPRGTHRLKLDIPAGATVDQLTITSTESDVLRESGDP